MLRKIATAAAVLGFGVSALAAGFDGKTLATNDWFDADFTTGIVVGSAVVANSTTGITYGAGSWTSVPANGTATIVADLDAGGEATCLAINAPGEELTFTPAALVSPTGMETSSLLVKGDAVDELPAMGADVQAAFAICDDGTAAVPCGYTAAGWTNLVYSGAMSGLTNAWCTVRVDFANVESVRYVRYSVQPAGGEMTILADADGATWFQAGCNATTITSVSLSGIGSCRTINGDSLERLGVASYNGVGYETFAGAIAAGLADNWAHGNVALLEDATWTPTATGTYNIDVNGHTLAISGASGSWSGTTYTVTKLTNYYWIGGTSTEWASGANWSHTAGGAAAGAYPNSESDTAFFSAGATINLSNSIATVRNIFTDGTLTFLGDSTVGSFIRTSQNSNVAPLVIGGAGLVRLAGIRIIAPYNTSDAATRTQISNNLEIVSGTTNILWLAINNKENRYSSFHVRGHLSGSGTLVVRSNNDTANYLAYFYGDASAFTGVFTDRMEGDDYAARINIMDAGALSPLATYNLTATYSKAGFNYILRAGGTGTTYRMGALDGEVHFDGNKNNNSQQYYGYTLEIGGKGENCSFGGTLARSGYASYTKKVGTADMTFTGSQMPNITIENGTYIVGASDALPGSMIFTGGAFSVADGVTVNPVASFSSESTAAVVFDDRGLDNTWTTLNDARVPCGFTKKGTGTLTLTDTPTHTTRTTVEGGTLVVPQGTTIAELSLAGGRLVVPLAGTEDETPVLTITALASGTDVEDLEAAVAIAGAVMTVEAGASGYVVKATRTAQTFTWTGAEDTAWANAANWTVAGVVADTAPLAVDAVSFPANCTVTLSANVESASLVIADGVRACFAADATKNIVLGSCSCGNGATLALSNIKILPKTSSAAYTLNIAGDVEIVEGTTNYLYGTAYRVDGNTKPAMSIEVSGALKGCGTVVFGNGSNVNRSDASLSGDNSGFSGEVQIIGSSDYKLQFTWKSADSGSALARWKVVDSSDLYLRFGFTAGTISFGSLEGSGGSFRLADSSSPSIAIGGNGGATTEFGFNVTRGSSSKSVNLIKKGSDTLVFSGKIANGNGNGNIVIEDGILDLAGVEALPNTGSALSMSGGILAVSAEVDPSAYIKNCTTWPITFSNAVGEVHTWATALADSNTDGLVKKGAGTLTLAKTPLYTGTTRIEGGQLVVQDEFNTSDTVIVVDDPAAAKAAGTWYIAAETLKGRPTLETSASGASNYRLKKSTVVIDGVTYQCYRVDEKTGATLILF